MSMNRTCPISNFTSEEDSVGRGFPSILGLAAVVLFQSNLFQNGLEARLVANAIVNLVDSEPPTGAILIFVTFLQPIQYFFLVPKSEIDGHACIGCDVPSFCQFIEIVKYLLGLSTIAGDSIRVPEPACIPWQVIQLDSFLNLGPGANQVPRFE